MSRRAASETVDAAEMRAKNSRLLLNLIWHEQRISQAELARRTGLSRSTVSVIVRQLESNGLIQVIGTGTSTGGRRPVLLGFCDDAFLPLGVEIGSRHITAALTDLRGNVRAIHSIEFGVRDDPEGALAAAKQLIDRCIASEPISRILGLGIGVPSPVDPAQPGRLSPLLIPAWRDYDVHQWFAERYPVPVFIDNDANLGALAEHWWGDENDDLTYIKIGTGIGAGHIIRGE
ncbi:MAG: ROK family transcriptional regulator, partial [Myxococcota bacterium]